MNRLACLKSQTSRLQRSWTTSAKLNMARQLSTSDILPRVTVLHNGVLNLHVLIVEYYVGLKDYPVSRNVYFYAYVSRLPLVNVVDQ